MSFSEPATNMEVRENLDNIDKHWISIRKQLDQRHTELDHTMEHWSEAELHLGGILNWLKHIRHQLKQAIPESYDDICRDLEQCKVESWKIYL